MAKHERQVEGATDEWLTPKYIIDALGPFDLDPASPVDRPWPTAAQHYTAHDDGLMRDWHGVVWLNPPYGRLTARWIERLVLHRNGLLLIAARVETRWFQRLVFDKADAILFPAGRIEFCRPSGHRMKGNGWPSAIAAYGPTCWARAGT